MPPPTTQTVFRWTSSSSGLDGLQPFLEPVPSPGAGEVLVKVRGMALNYKDVAIKHATYPFKIKDDLIPCSDMAGEVVAIGGPATELFGHGHCPVAVGDPVLSPVSPFFLYGGVDERPEALDVPWGGSKQDGVMREYVAVPAHSLIKLPACKSSRDFVKWAATPCTVSTVWNAFYGNAPLKPGDTVLTLGMYEVS
ncbi:GroES-like protein [Nemania sp. FL0916]|nr:GroES-like protein [Nemania sp. FL0916]